MMVEINITDCTCFYRPVQHSQRTRKTFRFLVISNDYFLPQQNTFVTYITFHYLQVPTFQEMFIEVLDYLRTGINFAAEDKSYNII